MKAPEGALPAGWCAVGRVVALHRHPVKSMAAQALTHAELDRYGIAGDRRVALRRRGDGGGFPWLSAGQLPALVRYRVDAAGSGGDAISAMQIHTPDGEILSCDGDAVTRHFADAHGWDVELMHLTHGMFDCAGLSILTRQTVVSLGAMLGAEPDVRRFRSNILIDVFTPDDPYPEDGWVGHAIAFGDPAAGPCAWVTETDELCSMIGLDPDTARANPEILRSVVRNRGNRIGVYATPTRTGPLAVGDVAYIRSS